MNKIDLTNKAKALDLLIQVIVLTMVFVIPEFFFSLGNSRPVSYGIYIHTILCIITFYFNYFFLIDRYLFRKKTFTYIVLALLTAVVMVMLMSLSNTPSLSTVLIFRPSRRNGKICTDTGSIFSSSAPLPASLP